MAGESDFCRFSRNEAPNLPKANFGWSKKLFQNSDKAWFLARRLRSTHFLVTLYIHKVLLKNKGNFWFTLASHMMRTSGYMAGESDFCRFLRNEAPNQSKRNFGWSKELF